uniref:Uncharacterized protein n=1 Tax=Siphoviridae sp. ct3pR10 TaxID=2826284 RepID=A0A8S5LWJ9_9CAUD|nr:MAG TPA: hypothetical protein [Siphoviridae sp. ct3pR10]
MDEIINLLSRIGATMETISVVGIDNQDKFVGCATAIRTVIRKLEQLLAVEKKEEPEGVDVKDG